MDRDYKSCKTELSNKRKKKPKLEILEDILNKGGKAGTLLPTRCTTYNARFSFLNSRLC